MEEYADPSFFVLRSPTLPLDRFIQWSEGTAAAGKVDADDEALANTHLMDEGLLRSFLRRQFGCPVLREAIFLASPSLHGDFDRWIADPESKQGRKVELTLVKYFARTTGRATPFGLFSGCSVGTVSELTRMSLASSDHYRRTTRLDTEYLLDFTEALGRIPEIRARLRYVPNSSLYRAAGRYRYAEGKVAKRRISYTLVGVERTEYLDLTLRCAEAGATMTELVDALMAFDADVQRDEAEAYVEELVEAQVLLSELMPSVTGPGAMDVLIEQLRTLATEIESACVLASVQHALAEIDAAGPGAAPAEYFRVADILAPLPADAQISRLFQVDMIKPAVEASLGRNVIDEIRRGIDVLHRLFGDRGRSPMTEFRDKFFERYGERWIPLAEALDEEIGIGFPGAPGSELSPLLAGMRFGGRHRPVDDQWAASNAYLLRRLVACAENGATTLALSDEDIAAMAAPQVRPLPESFAVMAELEASTPQEIDAGAFTVFVKMAFGPSAARLLGRFCHADPDLERHVRQHLRAEEALHPTKTFAEVVHLPQGRMGNVISRPVLRDHEIVFLGVGGAKRANQIPVTDLFVALRDGRIVLRSGQLDCEVLPRMSNAHNYSQGQAIYRFLCTLQSADFAEGLGWKWGPFASQDFLPRVQYGRIVLNRATWRLPADRLRAIAERDGAQRFKAVQRLRRKRSLPRFVVLVEGDNELPIDLDNCLSVNAFVEAVSGEERAILCEMFPDPTKLVVRGPEGRFVHELVIPFVKRCRDDEPTDSAGKPPATSTLPLSSRQSHRITRRFPPGSEWLYLKLYTGSSTADHILRETVGPAMAVAIDSGWIDQWFFIRYGDPEPHLRVRMHGDAVVLCRDLQPFIHDRARNLLEAGLAWKVQFDTYDRELERYGGAAGIELSERLFWADSEATLEILHCLTGDEGASARWQAALLSVDAILGDMGFTLEERMRLSAKARDDYAARLGATRREARRQVDRRYRQERRTIDALFDDARDGGARVRDCAAALSRRSERTAPSIQRLGKNRDLLGVPWDGLARSYVHMHVNRIMRSDQQRHEFLFYDFLARRYRSQLARARRSS